MLDSPSAEIAGHKRRIFAVNVLAGFFAIPPVAPFAENRRLVLHHKLRAPQITQQWLVRAEDSSIDCLAARRKITADFFGVPFVGEGRFC
jgi:hypothetical protein